MWPTGCPRTLGRVDFPDCGTVGYLVEKSNCLLRPSRVWVMSIEGTPASVAQLCVTAFWGGNLRLHMHSGKRICRVHRGSGERPCSLGLGAWCVPCGCSRAPSCSVAWDSSAKQPLRQLCGGLRRPGVRPHLGTTWLLVSFPGSRPAAFSWVTSIRWSVASATACHGSCSGTGTSYFRRWTYDFEVTVYRLVALS